MLVVSRRQWLPVIRGIWTSGGRFEVQVGSRNDREQEKGS